MIDYIYGVSLNGALPVATYRVVDETKKLYVIDRYVGSSIRKDTMADRWESYFTSKAEANKFLVALLDNIEKATNRLDTGYLYKELKELKELWNSEDTFERLSSLIRYVEEFI